MSWIARSSQDSRSALVITAAGAGILSCLATLAALSLRHKAARAKLEYDVSKFQHSHDDAEELQDYSTNPHKSNPHNPNNPSKPMDAEIIKEQLARNIAFYGEEGQKKVSNAFVIVVGMGGVGSSAATMLCRSGVGQLRIIDFDQVSLSSLNRHASATLADVGTPKVTASQSHFAKIAPWVKVDAINELFSLQNADRLLSGNPDYVVDCIDNIQTKVELMKYCHDHHIKIFSAMGAAGKSDPSRIQISDISDTFEDPLARAVRRRLKLEGVASGIPVVYSTEKPNENGKLLPLSEEEFAKGKVSDLSTLDAFRVRILPVLGPLPAMFGNAACCYVISQLAGLPMEPLAIKNRKRLYNKLYTDFSAREHQLTGSRVVPIDENDIAYIFEELHKGRSVVAPTFAISSRPCVVRWRKEEQPVWSNLVVMDKSEALKHEQKVLRGDEDPEVVWGEETAALVKRRQEEELEFRHYRL